MPWLFLLGVLAYGVYLVSVRGFADLEPFLFGAFVGVTAAAAFHWLTREQWRRRERALRESLTHVADAVSLVYLKHAPCPACGHSPDDEYADGFGTHAPTCPILAEITEFGGPTT
ncbi:MAG: hypothetical protein GWN84_11815 [Gammaproteobacteria bacterium]|nr:hypothetical protein [Gammaproteobacteria bacterium]NIR83554.1 hypothetical protein [Gammaproteobacteria bacterium]NIR91476.1 hypothetical protein [Gammaproteobacteria bacterium]NIU04716.1 hypothetical protein [Gammaproteobacteria bacterium]NIV51758.1 hypothetical protein [Gammaproteobacteria bacterium]